MFQAPGIGPKIAATLIQEFGCLSNLLAQAETIKQQKRRESLVENADKVRMICLLWGFSVAGYRCFKHCIFTFYDPGITVQETGGTGRLYTRWQDDSTTFISRCQLVAHVCIQSQSVRSDTVMHLCPMACSLTAHSFPSNTYLRLLDFYQRMELNACRTQLEQQLQRSQNHFKPPPSPEEYEGVPF